MSEVLTSLSRWFSKRPKLLQIAATQLLKQQSISDDDVKKLASVCLQEAEGKLGKTSCAIPASTFPVELLTMHR